MTGTARWTTWGRAASASVLALGIAACGGESPTTTTATGAPPTLAVATPFNDAGQCMNDDVQTFAGGPVNCTANDIRIARADVAQVDGQVVVAGTPIQCTPGQDVTITMSAVLEATSNKRRDDIGVWIATDGGDALTGQCRHYNLVKGSPGTINGGTIDGDAETPDACAGMAAGAQTTLDLDTFTVPCNAVQNPNVPGELALKIGSCLSWKVPGQDELCPSGYTTDGATYTSDNFRAATIPGTPAKCNCEGFYIPVEVVGTITIVKDAVPNDAQDFAFTSNATGATSFSLDDDADATLPNTKVATKLVAGSYTFTEGATSGWDLTDISCTNGTGAPVSTTTPNLGSRQVTINLAAGGDVTCTFTNTKRASLTIVKDAVPNDAQDFAFTTTGSGLSNFSLDDDADGTLPNQRTFDLAPGNYSVTESAVTGWDLTNLSCTAGGTPSGSTANIVLAAGASVTCTFTNTKRGNIVIIKDAVPNDPQDFAFTSSVTGHANFSLDDDADGTLSDTRNMTNVVPGAYTVTEGALSGWVNTAINCTDPTTNSSVNIATRTANINVAAGETVTCTFVNTKDGSITIIKDAVPNDAQDFAFTTTGTGLSNFSLDDDADATLSNTKVFSGLTAGAYTVTESAQSGWDLTAINCTGGGTTDVATRSASITLAAGQNVTCTFTNTKRASLTIVKDAVPNDAQDFAFTTTGSGLSGFSLDDDADGTLPNQRTFDLAPGNYSVAETAVAGWDLTNLVCSAGGTPSGSTANIVLAAGASVTCTFTNTKRGSITITKVTVPASDPQDFAFTTSGTGLSNFSLDTDAGDGTIPNTRTFTDLVPGNYSVTESGVTGWDLSNLVCSAGGTPSGSTANIVLPAGGSVSCTFTNRKRGTVIIKKETNPDGVAGSFPFTQNVDASGGFSLSDNGSKTFTNVVPNTSTGYTVTEGATSGFSLESLVCDNPDGQNASTVSGSVATIRVNPAETVTCTYTNLQLATLELRKVENGGLPLSFAWAFELRTGASPAAAGTTVASASANVTTGVVQFSGYFQPGQYQLCETGMPAGYSNNIAGFTPAGAQPEGADNSTECINITLASGANGPGGITGVPNPIDNVRPPGGDARTIGYWKNWSSCTGGRQYSNAQTRGILDRTLDYYLPAGSALYPIGDISGIVGSQTPPLTCLQAVNLLGKSDMNTGRKLASDPAYNLAAQFIASKLNYAAGAKQCAAATSALASAQTLLDAIGFVGTGTYRSKMTAQQISDANSYATTLDRYNNNTLCP